MSEFDNVPAGGEVAPAPEAVVENNEAGLESGGEGQVVETPEQKAEAKRIKALKLKIHGEEVTEELPFEIDDNPEAVQYLTKQLQLSKAAQRAMQEKSSFEKQVQHFFQGLKGNTRAALQDLGIDPREFAAQVIEDEIRKSQMSPEQLKQMELEQELTRLKEESKQREEDFNRREYERVKQIELEKLDTQMSQALSASDLPKNPAIVRRITEYMIMGAQNGVDLNPQDVIPLVRREMFTDLQDIINALPEDQAEEFIGKEVLTRFRKKNLAKAKAPGMTPATAKAAIKDAAGKTAVEKPSDKVEFRKFFGF
jgi:hypothetical protein